MAAVQFEFALVVVASDEMCLIDDALVVAWVYGLAMVCGVVVEKMRMNLDIVAVAGNVVVVVVERMRSQLAWVVVVVERRTNQLALAVVVESMTIELA